MVDLRAQRAFTIARLALIVASLYWVGGQAQSVESAGLHAPNAVTISSDIVNFILRSLTVGVGDRVTWTNRDGPPHTTTSGQNGVWDGVDWNSDFLSTDESFSRTFNSVGSFPYTCRVHPSMNATVTVQAGPVAPTATPFPELTVVSPEEVTPADPNGGAVAVVQPTAAIDVGLPDGSAMLKIPAPIHEKTIQVRLRSLDPGEVTRDDVSVVRLVDIEVFDTDAVRLDDVRFWSTARLSIILSREAVDGLGGLGAVVNGHATRNIRIQREAGPSRWSDLLTSFDITTRTFSARVSRFSRFSRFALIAPAQLVAAASPTPTVAPPIAPATGDVGLSGSRLLLVAALGTLLAVGGGVLRSRVRRRP